ncbi:MAG: hypothetical protein II240_00055 [Bacteroidaceae bacterium]|nr:hypothetical protein [Bacteroidaceae bacterium]
MKKGLQNKFRMCAVCLAALAFPAVSIAQTTNDLKGFWERTTVTGKTSGQFAAHPNKYYKAIGDEGFLLIELPPQANPNIKGFFTAKGGNCQRTSETVMVEGNAEVKTHKNDKGMVVEWTDGNGEEITEQWQKVEPDANIAKMFSTITQDVKKPNPFTGVWQMKQQYVISNNSPHYENVKEKYKIIGDDMYFGFYTISEQQSIGYMRGWYGKFEYLENDKISENGGEPTRIIWTDENQFVYIYCPSAEKKKENFIYEIWIRTELPEYAKKAFSALAK